MQIKRNKNKAKQIKSEMISKMKITITNERKNEI